MQTIGGQAVIAARLREQAGIHESAGSTAPVLAQQGRDSAVWQFCARA